MNSKNNMITVLSAVVFLATVSLSSASWEFETSIDATYINGIPYELVNCTELPDGTLTFMFVPLPADYDPSVPANEGECSSGVQVGFSGGYVDEQGVEHEEWDTGYIM